MFGFENPEQFPSKSDVVWEKNELDRTTITYSCILIKENRLGSIGFFIELDPERSQGVNLKNISIFGQDLHCSYNVYP